jgi:hypothetical protein
VAPLVRAALFGLGAAVAGAILYYAVVAITDFEIGLVSIAIGYMVGFAIRKGTGGLGGRLFQVTAVVLTYWAVGLAYVLLAVGAAADRQAAPAPADAQVTVAPSEADGDQPVAGTDTPEAEPMSTPAFIAYAIFFSFALPVLVIVGSLPGGLLSAAIIGFGMHQAWRMTAAPQLTITGPFRVGTAAQALT